MLLSMCWHGQGTFALSTDKEQPIEIEADTGELDDIKNISIYRGNVVVIQGSIRMTGDKMTVYFTENEDIDTIIMEGNPATYRQLPDDSDVYDEAEALTMEYYELRNLIILIDKAWVKDADSILTGDRIEYDTLLSQVKAWHDKNKPAGPEKKDRVKLIIKPKKKPSETE